MVDKTLNRKPNKPFLFGSGEIPGADFLVVAQGMDVSVDVCSEIVLNPVHSG
jgi:hypothetical protein